MPFKSKKQQIFFNANKKRLEMKGVDVDEWNRETKGRKLPLKVKKKKNAKIKK